MILACGFQFDAPFIGTFDFLRKQDASVVGWWKFRMEQLGAPFYAPRCLSFCQQNRHNDDFYRFLFLVLLRAGTTRILDISRSQCKLNHIS